MRPYHILLFLLLVFALGLGTAAVWPKDGLPLSREWKLSFVSWESLFSKDTTQAVNVDSLLASYALDTKAIKDSLRLAEIAYRQKAMRIQYADSGGLWKFFKGLSLREQGQGKIRILHYGDSQIEGDRMTSDIRDGLQKRFGGTGFGYIAAAPLTSNLSVVNSQSDNWKRFPVFGSQDSTLTHNRFGMYGVFSRFTPFPKYDTLFHSNSGASIDSLNEASAKTYTVRKIFASDSTTKAWINLSPSKIGYYTSRKYSKLSLLFRNPDAAFTLKVKLSDSTVTERTFNMNGAAQEYHQNFDSSPTLVRLEFSGKSSPDIYGIRLESDYGVLMDNIPMRGSSGTYFGSIHNAEMSTQFANTQADLIILQFGGNTVPYMIEEKQVKRYGSGMGAQIRYLQRMNPNAEFILIGPSDMSVKEETKYVTYPILPAIRDALKEAALANNCGYWDMYEVMGGKNSMPGWVAADPPLAAPDYVHFTRHGTKKIAELFFEALMKDYEDWKKSR